MRFKNFIIVLIFLLKSLLISDCNSMSAKPDIEKAEYKINIEGDYKEPADNKPISKEISKILVNVNIENGEYKNIVRTALTASLIKSGRNPVIEKEKNVFSIDLDDENQQKVYYDAEIEIDRIDVITEKRVVPSSMVKEEDHKITPVNYSYLVVYLYSKLLTPDGKLLNSKIVRYTSIDLVKDYGNQPLVNVKYIFDYKYDSEKEVWKKELMDIEISDNFNSNMDNRLILDNLITSATDKIIKESGL